MLHFWIGQFNGLYARAHVHIQEIISISGQSKTKWEKECIFLSLIMVKSLPVQPGWLDANGKLTWGISRE